MTIFIETELPGREPTLREMFAREFDESKVKRDEGGQFANKAEQGTKEVDAKAAKHAAEATFFRVSNGPTLPTHWAYSDPWDLEESEEWISEDEAILHRKVVDRRAPGYQGWSDLSAAVSSTVSHPDGDYGPEDYAHLLLVTPDKIKSGGSGWWEVAHGAKAVSSVSLPDLHKWLSAKEECTDEHGELDVDSVQAYVESHENDVRSWMAKNAESHSVEFKDTLPMPESYRQYLDEDEEE